MKYFHNNESLEKEIMDLEAIDFSKINGGHVVNIQDEDADSLFLDCYRESYKADTVSQQ